MTTAPTNDAVREARATAAIARANAETDYYRMVQASFAGSLTTSYGGASPSRLDRAWPRGDYYQGEVRWQDYSTLSSLRDRACLLEEENWLACGVLDRSVENVVGTMIRVEPRTKSKANNATIKNAWKKWANTTACDVRGENDFGGICRLLHRGKLRDGDHGLLLTFVLDQDGRRRPKVQIIEPHRIESPPGIQMGRLPNGNQIADGIEMNTSGKAVAFHIRYTDLTGVIRWERVLARDFIYIKRSNRYSNVRGMTVFKGGFTLFEQILGYLDSVVTAARVGASQAMIQKRKNPAAILNQMRQATVANKDTGTVNTERWTPIQPGMINVVDVDEDLVAFNPAQPQQQFPAALDAFCRILGTKFGLTLEQVLLNFAQTSYSSGKMAQRQAQKTAGIEQQYLAVMVITRVYQWFVSLLIESGELVMDAGVDDEWAHEWIPPAAPSPEPLKDMQAREKALEMGIEARSNMAMEDGYDFEEICEQNEADRLMMAEKQLPINDQPDAGVSIDENGKLVFSGQQAQNQPPDTSEADELAFKRNVVLKLLDDKPTKAVIFNITGIPELVKDTGITIDSKVQTDPSQGVPLLPVISETGALVSGAAIYDPQGVLVGGDVENQEPADLTDPSKPPANETKPGAKPNA